MSTLDQREETRYRQDVLASYRIWLAYLEAQQTLLAAAAETQRGIDPFEGSSPTQERAEAARRRIAALPADRRELFEAVYEQERHNIQRHLDQEAQIRGGTVKRTDPDEVARRALTRLHEEARGLHRDDRRGMLPRGKPDAIKWLALDLTELEQAPPTETDYQIAGSRHMMPRRIMMNIGMAIIALIAIPSVVFFLQPARPQQYRAVNPASNGALLTPWPITSLSAEAQHWSSDVQSVNMRWPSSCYNEQQPTACWIEGSFYPLEICLPVAQLDAVTALRLDAADDQPSRLFTLGETPLSDSELIVSACDDQKQPPRYGRLQRIEPIADLVPGIAAPSGFTVTSIRVRGRGEDPAIPDGNLVIAVTAEDTEPARDWVALMPTLLLADGTRRLPGATEYRGKSIHFEYLIPAQADRFEARWFVARAEHSVRYRVSLDPPPTRDTFLRTALQIEHLPVIPSRQTMQSQLILHNTTDAPLAVVPTDLSFQTQIGRRDVAAPMLQQPLRPGERRTITLDLPLESGVLQLGPFRFELAVRR